MRRRSAAVLGAWLASVDAVAQPPPTVPPSSSPAPIEVTVQETSARPVSDVELRVGAEEGRRGAGTQGDAVKALQALPGLARAGAGAGQVIAWGSAPHESRLYVDGVEIPALYHGSGIRSVLPSGWVSRLDFLPGAYGVAYGRGLGGVVALQTRPLDMEAWHASAHADLLDAGLSLSFAPAAGMAFAAAFRHSVVDRWLPRLEGAEVGSLLTVPTYRDGQAKAAIVLSESERVELVFIGSDDRWSYAAPSTDPANRTTEERTLEFTRWYLRYVREQRDERIEVTPFVGLERALQRTRATWGRTGLVTRGVPYGIRADQWLGGSGLGLRLGVDVRGGFSHVEREGTLALPPREGDPRIFGQLPGPDVAVEGADVHVLDVAPQAELTLRSGSLTATAGLRLDTYLIETDRVMPPRGRVPPVGSSRVLLGPEPRLALSYDLDARSRLIGAAGVHHQAPDPEDLSAAFGNPTLRLARSLQLALGEEVRFDPATSVSVLGHYKRLTGVVVRSPEPTPESAEVLLDAGEGRSFGVQLLARRNLRQGWSGWLAWTLSRSERRRRGEAYRLFDYDQPQVISAVLNRSTGGWSFAARFRYATGSPRTPVVGASLNLMTDRYEPIPGPVNSTRLPDFFALDLRVDRALDLGRDTKLHVYADALNVTGRRNAEEIVYGADYEQQAHLLGLPALLVVGARIER